MNENDKQAEPVYAYRRRGLDEFCTCDESRYTELSAKPSLFEVAVFYRHPAHPVQPAVAQGEPVRLNDDDLTKIYMRFVGHQGLYPRLFEDIAGCVMTAMFEKSPPPAAAINEQLLEVLKGAVQAMKMYNLLYGVPKFSATVTKGEAAIAAAEAEKAKGGV